MKPTTTKEKNKSQHQWLWMLKIYGLSILIIGSISYVGRLLVLMSKALFD